jgi:hypothetical protein
MSSEPTGDGTRIHLVSAWLCAIAFVVVTFLGRVVYLQDLPEWVYQSSLMAAKLADPTSVTSVELRWLPIPNGLFVWLLAGIGQVTGFVTATKILVGLYVVACLYVCQLILRHFDPRGYGWKTLLAVPVFVLSSSFLNGYLSYQLGFLFLLAFVYLAVCRERIAWWQALLLGLGTYFSHATMFLVLLMLAALLLARKRLTTHAALALTPGVALLVWYAAMTLFAQPTDKVEVPNEFYASAKEMAMHKGYTLAKQGPYQGFLLPNGRSYMEEAGWFYKAGSAINVLVAVALLLTFGWLLMRGRRSEGFGAGHATLLAVATIVATLYLVLPPALLQVVNIGERFVVPGLFFVLALAPLNPRLGAIAAWVCLAVSLPCVSFFLRASELERLPPPNGGLTKEERDDPEAQYRLTSQRLFNRRPYQFVDRYEWTRGPEDNPVGFQTGFLKNVQPK